MAEKKRALVVPVDGEPYVTWVEGLKGMQDAVGGLIEPVSWIFDDEPTVYVNEEGLYTCTPNRAVWADAGWEGRTAWSGRTVHEGDLICILFGDMLCMGYDPETGASADITDEEADKVMARFGRETVGDGFMAAMAVKAGMLDPVF